MIEFRFDPEELLKHELIVDKFEVAKRQIISAIKMFFYEWDVVSQHTLLGAAHQILCDISKIEGKSLSIKDSPLIKEDKRKEFIKAVNMPQNYFKHAEKDHKQKLIFKYQFVPFYLFDTIRMYILLSSNDPCFEMRIFLMWFQLRYPDLLNYPAAEKDLQKIRADTKNPDTFRILGQYLLEKGQMDIKE
ncbi:MAG: hypothetical protein GY834_08125 [Bacteroidetes bacterium]|nr:hypothetical protein [Bacteroidota bacterium]